MIERVNRNTERVVIGCNNLNLYDVWKWISDVYFEVVVDEH